MGKGTTSVMENSRTLKAGDKIAHYAHTISTHITQIKAHCYIRYYDPQGVHVQCIGVSDTGRSST